MSPRSDGPPVTIGPFLARSVITPMLQPNTLKISLSPMDRVFSAGTVAPEINPLRRPSGALSPLGQAIDVLDCIEEAQGWSEHLLQDAEQRIDGLVSRAAALGVSTLRMRMLVTACIDQDPGERVDAGALVAPEALDLVHELRHIAAALQEAGTRARVATKHVMRLSLLVPGLARRARLTPEIDDPRRWKATDRWLVALPARAKARAEQARGRLASVPTRADLLRDRLQNLVVPTRRLTHRDPSDNEVTQPLGCTRAEPADDEVTERLGPSAV